ncbi:MAG: hydrogenase maturation protein [Gallionellales bacterium RIFCSPLOWO2_02_FULL_59_110]|nr:MAG: hydrogenase maturation protein [Gallionellales bacterium RIFCSPLOWO2_02_FULL_59_110]OGT01700.1 MAG: hydrogenase maturation protein [Gallionellales bacterium RIFCSPLOWO2_02_58_13]
MKILFITHSFNSLAQRLYIELAQRGHEVSIELDINDAVTAQAVELYRPDLIVAPFLKRIIPEAIWRNHTCFVVHPGIVGDRGPSALDWAIMRDCAEWGVTVLQASGEMDAGDIWAAETFPMRLAKKSSLYRNEVIEAAVRAVLAAVERFQSGNFKPQPLDYSRPEVRGRLHAPIKQIDRAIDWQRDDTRAVLKKIHAADGFPGVLDMLCGEPYYLFDTCAEDALRGEPGAIIATRNGAICRATLDGAVWIGHLKRKTEGEPAFKLPATLALGKQLADAPEIPLDPFTDCAGETYRDIRFEQKNNVGYLHFAFYNGAMSTEQCERLREAYVAATQRDVRVIVLMGGADFWSNGIHLNCIEAAASPADESWRNINAMNDLMRAIITTGSQLTVAALQGNAGAGGVFLSLAADHVYARAGVVFNPHYKGMGNLYGSEYWTYLLPRRAGEARAAALTQNRLPVGAAQARQMGLIDGCFGTGRENFLARIEQIAEGLAASPDYPALLRDKTARRERDEQEKPLEAYRAEELQHMKLNFYGFDPSYHVARYNFVYKIPHAWTPLYLARHRRIT